MALYKYLLIIIISASYLQVIADKIAKLDNYIFRIGEASAVMRQLHQSVVLQRELYAKTKLSIFFRSVYAPILTYGHECWIMNEKVRTRVQAAEMGFLRRISGLTLLDNVKRADSRESLNIESLLLRRERLRLRRYGHVTRMSLERSREQPKNCSVQQRVVEGLEPVPELEGKITLKILVGLALASHQSIYLLFQRFEMLGSSNSSSCPQEKAGLEK